MSWGRALRIRKHELEGGQAAQVCSKRNWALAPTALSALPRIEIQPRGQSPNTMREGRNPVSQHESQGWAESGRLSI